RAVQVEPRLAEFALYWSWPHPTAALDLASAATRAALVPPLLGHDLRFLGRLLAAAPPPPNPTRSGGTYTHVVPRWSTKSAWVMSRIRLTGGCRCASHSARSLRRCSRDPARCRGGRCPSSHRGRAYVSR